MASEFDISQAAALVYAESLLQLASERGIAQAVGDELQELANLWKQEPAFAALMKSAAIDKESRRQSLLRIFGDGRIGPLTMNLLLVLNAKRRAMILPAVCDAYRLKMNAFVGRQEATVTSAVPLDDGQRSHLKTELKRLTGKDPLIVERVDPNLLGGLSVQMGDRVYDLSVRRRLQDLRRDLALGAEKIPLQGLSKFVTQG